MTPAAIDARLVAVAAEITEHAESDCEWCDEAGGLCSYYRELMARENDLLDRFEYFP